MLLAQLVGLGGERVPLVLQLFVQLQLMLVHLRLQLVFQAHQLLLVLPPHAFVAGHLLTQRRALLVLLDLTGHLEDGGQRDTTAARFKDRSAQQVGSSIRKMIIFNVILINSHDYSQLHKCDARVKT